MEGEEEASDDPRSFSGKPAWKKFIILVAGAFLNFVTGLVILLVLFSVAGSPSAPVVSGYLPGAEDIRETGLLDEEGTKASKKVLSAAAMTYVAAVGVALMSLLRLVMILFGARGRRD